MAAPCAFVRVPVAVAACALLAAHARASVSNPVFGPLAPAFRVSQAQMYDQIWSNVARVGSQWWCAWSAGQDIVLRRYDASLAPLTGDLLVNSTLNLETQDEPAIAVATGGNVLVAWSDRHGYDGEQMGIFGRVYGSNGTPLGAEIRIDQIGAASQWRPLITPTPSGGFVVAWSGDWDGNAYLRVLGANGAPQSNDVLINQYTFDAQVDPAVGVAPDGTMLAAFVDFSSHGGVGTNLNLWARRFDASGNALGNEFVVPSTFVNGDQRSPRVACDASGRFVVVWQDQLADGSGYGIVMRRFDAAGAPLGSDFVVNTTTAGDQIAPNVSMRADGLFLVAWEDHAGAFPRLRGRRFDASGAPLDRDAPLTDVGVWAERPQMARDAASGDLVLAYDTWNGADYDVMAQRFAETDAPQVFCAAKVNSHGCTPQIAWSGVPSATQLAPFTISATNVIRQAAGLLVYGSQSTFKPFQGGTLCMLAPKRTQLLNAGGNVGQIDCSGSYAVDFNARVRSGVDPSLVVGSTVVAQFYYRDLPASFGVGLTDAVRFTIAP